MKKVSIFCFVAIFSTPGCKTITTSTANGKVVHDVFTEDIYKAKVAFCPLKNLILSEEVTKFVGNDRRSPPEKRLAEKELAWKTWNSEVAEVKKEIQGKLFRVELPAAFGNYDKNKNRMALINHKFKDDVGATRFYRVDSDIPQRLLLNLSGYLVVEPYPTSIPNVDKVKWAYSNFANPSFTSKDIYVINQSISSGRRSTDGSRGGKPRALDNDTLGVEISTDLWTSNPQSPIYREGDYTYLDLNKFDFVDSFGVYPDTGIVHVRVEYIFEIINCIFDIPEGKLREVVISVKPIPGVISSKKQIGRVIL